MLFAVVVFPGSNCDHDAYHAARHVLGQQAEYLWHKDAGLKGADAIVLPGGFSHGDYLRTGAIARFSPIMREVEAFAARGGPVLGICNGFQVLLEAGLLPGAMLRNRSQKFACKWVHVRVENAESRFLQGLEPGAVLRLPIAHGEGSYYSDPETLARPWAIPGRDRPERAPTATGLYACRLPGLSGHLGGRGRIGFLGLFSVHELLQKFGSKRGRHRARFASRRALARRRACSDRPVQIGRVAADRLDQSSSAIPIFETGARLSDRIEHTIFGSASAAFDPHSGRSIPHK